MAATLVPETHEIDLLSFSAHWRGERLKWPEISDEEFQKKLDYLDWALKFMKD